MPPNLVLAYRSGKSGKEGGRTNRRIIPASLFGDTVFYRNEAGREVLTVGKRIWTSRRKYGRGGRTDV